MTHTTDTNQTPLHVRFAAMDDDTLAARWVDELSAMFARFADFDNAAWFRSALLVVQRRLTPVCRVGTPEDATDGGEAQGVPDAKVLAKRAKWRARAKRERERREARRAAVVAGVEAS